MNGANQDDFKKEDCSNLKFEVGDKFDPKLLEVFYKHYTDLFMYQARQRLDVIRYFFVGYAILINSLVAASKYPEAACIIGVIGGVLALVFLRLDYRNAQIVEIDEKPLKCLHTYTRNMVGAGDFWETFKRLDSTAERQNFTTYGSLIPVLYTVFWTTSFVAGAFFFDLAVKKNVPDISICARVFVDFATTLVLFAAGFFGTRWRPIVDRIEFTIQPQSPPA